MAAVLAPPGPSTPLLQTDLFGDPLRPPTRRERHRVATVPRGVAAAMPAAPTFAATPPPPSPALVDPALPPGVWKADELSPASGRCQSSGFALLDADLPGGGWPTRALTELLLPQVGCVEWRLLAPGLAPCTQRGQRLLLIGPPHAPHPRGLAAWGIGASACLWVNTPDTRQRLWALEQAIKADADELGALLAWLPQLRPEQLRRLQTLAARCRAPVFVLRGTAQAGNSSAAPLRLRVQPGPHWSQLQVEFIKRRGPPLDTPLWLHAPPPTLAAVLPPPQRQASRSLPAALQALVHA
ncbi:MAG: translesion DNA synthesis-associated protein ImuA [Burkholderiales bacterium]